jgi:hypothetical protein
MRKYITLLLPLLMACGSNSCKPETTGVPVPTPSVSSVTPVPSETVSVPEPSTQPSVEPPKEVGVEWYPYDEKTYDLLKSKTLCAFVYFGNDCENCLVMEELFKNPEVIQILNDGFISFRYPINKDTDDHRKNVLHVVSLPTVMLVPNSSKEQVLSATHVRNLKDLMVGLKDKVFSDCAESKKDHSE